MSFYLQVTQVNDPDCPRKSESDLLGLSIARYQPADYHKLTFVEFARQVFPAPTDDPTISGGELTADNFWLVVRRLCNNLALQTRRGTGNRIAANQKTLDRILNFANGGMFFQGIVTIADEEFDDDEIALYYEGNAIDAPYYIDTNSGTPTEGMLAYHANSHQMGYLFTAPTE